MVMQASGNYDSHDPRPVVFYDGDCPLCRREIDHYRRVDRASRIRWVDAASDPDSLGDFGLTLDVAMAELHVLDVAGQWQRGVDAFLVIWDHLPRYRWLTALVRGLRLRSPLGVIYRHFARWRYRRRCDTAGCSVAGDSN